MFSWFKRLLRFGRGVERRPNCHPSDEDKVHSASELPRVTTGGMRVVAMIGDYDRSRLPASNDQIELVDTGGRAVTAKCGHSSSEDLTFNV
jgi:hypothetical protein